MKRTKRGVTLVEVLVAIAVFAIISLALFSSVIAMKNVIIRQEEYVKIEMICYDIDAYYEKYSTDWPAKYFGEDVEPQKGYLTPNFEPTVDVNESAYIVHFENDRIISITNIEDTIVYVENVVLTGTRR